MKICGHWWDWAEPGQSCHLLELRVGWTPRSGGISADAMKLDQIV